MSTPINELIQYLLSISTKKIPIDYEAVKKTLSTHITKPLNETFTDQQLLPMRLELKLLTFDPLLHKEIDFQGVNDSIDQLIEIITVLDQFYLAHYMFSPSSSKLCQFFLIYWDLIYQEIHPKPQTLTDQEVGEIRKILSHH